MLNIQFTMKHVVSAETIFLQYVISILSAQKIKFVQGSNTSSPICLING